MTQPAPLSSRSTPRAAVSLLQRPRADPRSTGSTPTTRATRERSTWWIRRASGRARRSSPCWAPPCWAVRGATSTLPPLWRSATTVRMAGPPSGCGPPTRQRPPRSRGPKSRCQPPGRPSGPGGPAARRRQRRRPQPGAPARREIRATRRRRRAGLPRRPRHPARHSRRGALLRRRRRHRRRASPACAGSDRQAPRRTGGAHRYPAARPGHASDQPGGSMNALTPYAAFFMRLAVGGVFLIHGLSKFHRGIPAVAGFFGSVGIPFPSVGAFVVIVVETIGAACVILGIFTRPWALCMMFEMAVAMLVQLHGRHNIELEGLLFAGPLTLVALGDGPLSIAIRFKRPPA